MLCGGDQSCSQLQIPPTTGDTFTGSPWLLHRLLPTACLVFLCYAKDIYSELHFFSQLLTTSHRPAPQNRLRTLFWWESPCACYHGDSSPSSEQDFPHTVSESAQQGRCQSSGAGQKGTEWFLSLLPSCDINVVFSNPVSCAGQTPAATNDLKTMLPLALSDALSS